VLDCAIARTTRGISGITPRARSPADAGYISAYISSTLTEHVLKQAGDKLTRANIMHLDGVQAPLLLPSITIKTTPTNYSLIDKFRVQQFKSGRWVPVAHLRLARKDPEFGRPRGAAEALQFQKPELGHAAVAGVGRGLRPCSAYGGARSRKIATLVFARCMSR